jgi:hypothetical protein
LLLLLIDCKLIRQDFGQFPSQNANSNAIGIQQLTILKWQKRFIGSSPSLLKLPKLFMREPNQHGLDVNGIGIWIDRGTTSTGWLHHRL